MVFQSGQVLYPIPRIEIGYRSIGSFYYLDFRMMYMAAYHIVVSVCYSDISGRPLKIIDELDRRFDAVLYFLGHGYRPLTYFFIAKVDRLVDQDQHIITNRPEPGQPFGVLHGYVENITVKHPRLFSVYGEYQFVRNGERAQFEPDELSQHLVVVTGNVVHLYAF